tara:strand:- start:183 stop:497 length:315 start_codon:yes stop_codon:yes gene_type:complete
MAIEYTWTVGNTEYETTSGSKGIVTLHWRCTAVDGDHSVSSYGTTSHTPDPSDSSFIAYDSVTESNCIAWVQAQIDKDATEANLSKGIDNLKNPPTASGVPWAA